MEGGRIASVGADEAMGCNRLGENIRVNPWLQIPIVTNLYYQSQIQV
jgi:hypothetical protein